MTDLLTATQDAFYAVLAPALGGELGPVVQHVLEGSEPPLTVIGRIDAADLDGKDEGLEQHTVEVIYTYRGARRRKLYEMAQAGRDALRETPLTAPGAIFGRPAWISTESDIDEDGVTYQAVSTFQVIVQAA